MVIGLDLRASSLKAILIDDRQTLIAEHTVPLMIQRRCVGWSAQVPASWGHAMLEALRALRGKNDRRGLKGIGRSGHMLGAS